VPEAVVPCAHVNGQIPARQPRHEALERYRDRHARRPYLRPRTGRIEPGATAPGRRHAAPSAPCSRRRTAGPGRVSAATAAARRSGGHRARQNTLFGHLQRLPWRRRAWWPARWTQPAALAARARRSGRRGDLAGRPEGPSRQRHAASADHRTRRESRRGLPSLPPRCRRQAGIATADRYAAAGCPRRRRVRGQGVLRRQVHELPSGDGRSTGSLAE
jgi:hypothetical protein